MQNVAPVSEGELLSALTGEFDIVVPGGPVVFEVAAEGTADSDAVVPLLSPGDCPGGMNGDCGALVTYEMQAAEAAERAAAYPGAATVPDHSTPEVVV